MTMKNKETLEKLRTYQIGVIRSVIASRQGRSFSSVSLFFIVIENQVIYKKIPV